MCKHATLPTKLVQENSWNTDATVHTVHGKIINLRDHFGFPRAEINHMEHDIDIQVRFWIESLHFLVECLRRS